MKILKVIDLFTLIIFIVLHLFNSSVLLLFFLLLNYLYIIITSILYCEKNCEKPFYCIFRNLCWLLLNIYLLDNVNLLNLGNIFKFSIGTSFLGFIILILIFKNRPKSTLLVILTFAVMNIFYISNSMMTASKLFAYNPTFYGVGEIVELNMPSRDFFGIDGVFSFELNINDENLKQTTTILTNKDNYYNYEIGDKVHYTVYNGLWKEKYITVQ